MSLHHKTNIVFINGNLTAPRYEHEVLDTEGIPLLRNHRGKQLLHDCAPAHRTRATTAYLKANNVNVVDSPPPNHRITRFKHNRNIWDELKRCLRRTGAIPTTLNQLKANILYEFNNFPQNYVQCYVTSMRRRCLAVVNSLGDIPATKFT